MGVREKNPSRLILVASGTLSKDSKGWALENNDHLPESLELIMVIIVRKSSKIQQER